MVVEDDMNDLANRRLGLEAEEARQIGAVGVGKVRGHYGGVEYGRIEGPRVRGGRLVASIPECR
jgi:hypothetical protein